MVEVAYKFRIYPTQEQQENIKFIMGTARYVWNFFLAMRKQEYSMFYVNVPYSKCSTELTKLKHTKGFEWLLKTDSTALQASLEQLDQAYQSFFRKDNGFPKFKSKKSTYQSYTTKNNHNSIRLEKNDRYVKLPKVGFVRVHCSKKLSGTIQRATISRTPTGKYYVSILCRQEKPELKNKVQGKACGIDLGEHDLVILSDGNKIQAARSLKKQLKKLALEQERLSRKRIEVYRVGVDVK